MKVMTRLLVCSLIGVLAMAEAQSASAFPLFRSRKSQAAPVVATSSPQQSPQVQTDKAQPDKSIAGQGAEKTPAPQAAKDEGQPSKDATAAGNAATSSDSKSGAQRNRTARSWRLFGRRRAA